MRGVINQIPTIALHGLIIHNWLRFVNYIANTTILYKRCLSSFVVSVVRNLRTKHSR